MKALFKMTYRMPLFFLFPGPWAFLLLVSILVLGRPLVSQAVEPGPDLFPEKPVLADYLEWAQQRSPRLAGQTARAEALRASAQSLGALPALKLAWGEMLVPVETRVGPQQRVFSVSQSFPWFGTLSAKENSRVAEADAAQEILRGVGWQVEREVRAAWYELIFLRGRTDLVVRNLELARQTEVHARARYETGEGPYVAMLHAQMEIGRLDARLTGLRDRLTPATARLNIAAGLPAGMPTPEVQPLAAEKLVAELPAAAELERVLRHNNPELASMRFAEEGRRYGVAAAERRSYPDLTVGVDYIMTGEAIMPGVQDSGRDPVIARVAVNIPLWGGQAGAEQKASAGRLRATSAGLTDTRLQLSGRLQDILFAWREAGRNLDLYGESLLPRSTQNLSVIMASYESGQVDFDQLQAVRQAHLGLELALLRAENDRVLALNDLSALLGVSVDDLVRGHMPVESNENESE